MQDNGSCLRVVHKYKGGPLTVWTDAAGRLGLVAVDDVVSEMVAK